MISLGVVACGAIVGEKPSFGGHKRAVMPTVSSVIRTGNLQDMYFA
jgi:hypothetical protein